MLKLLTVAVAGVLALLTVKNVYSGLQKARVRTPDPREPRAVTRLRQDPRTGVYYPET